MNSFVRWSGFVAILTGVGWVLVGALLVLRLLALLQPPYRHSVALAEGRMPYANRQSVAGVLAVAMVVMPLSLTGLYPAHIRRSRRLAKVSFALAVIGGLSHVGAAIPGAVAGPGAVAAGRISVIWGDMFFLGFFAFVIGLLLLGISLRKHVGVSLIIALISLFFFDTSGASSWHDAAAVPLGAAWIGFGYALYKSRSENMGAVSQGAVT